MFKRDKQLTITRTLNDKELAALREPRNDLVAERPVGEDRYELLHGPFSKYERTISVNSESKEVNHVHETFSWRLSIPFWGVFFSFLGPFPPPTTSLSPEGWSYRYISNFLF